MTRRGAVVRPAGSRLAVAGPEAVAYAAAQRFAAVPPAAQRAWLGARLPARRSGAVTPAQLP